MKMSLVLRLPRKMHLCRSSSNVPRLPSFVEMIQNLHVLLTFEKVHNPLRLPGETTSEPPKVARTCGVLYILTSKCASRNNGVYFFDISTSKSGPDLVCFAHFDFEMCFAPFRHTSNAHLGFATASLESGSANIDNSPLQEALLGMPMSGFSTGTVNLNPTSCFWSICKSPSVTPAFGVCRQSNLPVKKKGELQQS